MLSNDISKRLMIRFKKSKDFNKTIEKLKEEHYIIRTYKSDINGYNVIEVDTTEDKHIRNKNMGYLVRVVYEDNTDIESPYKQNIWGIYY